MDPASLPLIAIDRLRPGIYIVLDLGWRNHPFLRSRFLLRSEEQIDELRALGLSEVRWSPADSTAQPLDAAPPAEPAASAAIATPAPVPLVTPWIDVEPPTAEEWDSVSLRRVEDEYTEVANRHQQLLKQLLSAPEEARKTAEQVADTLFSAVAECDQPAARLLSQRVGQQSASHEVGVSALALLLAREAGVAADTLQDIALAALLHGIGKLRLPALLQEDDGQLSEYERGSHRQYVGYGVEMARAMGLSERVVQGIAQHRERIDGSGFPAGLKGEQIGTAGRIVAIAYRYMRLVAPRNTDAGLTPHQALQQMFANERAHFDADLLARFVRILGVYPPGTVVELSDQRLALVVASRPGAALAPRVQLLDSVDDNGESSEPPIDTATEGPLRVRRSVPPSELGPVRAKRLRQLARTALYVEPQTAPEWRSWDDQDGEQAAVY
jgi:putative nucleotidyltransferase with HDIG domain